MDASRGTVNRWKSWDPPPWVVSVAITWLVYFAALIFLVLSLGVPYIYQKSPWS